MLTAHTDADTIVAAMKAGASDYVTKPFEVRDVSLRISRALEGTRSNRELRRLREDLARPFSFASMIGESEPMQRVKALARKVTESPASTRPDHRRKRDGQGSAGEGHSLQQPPGGAAVHEHHVLGHARDAARIRALRPRAGRVHRRAPAEARTLRNGRRRDGLSRRDRRDGAGAAGQAPARARRESVSPPRRRRRISKWTCESSRRPTGTSRARSAKGSSARICTTG